MYCKINTVKYYYGVQNPWLYKTCKIVNTYPDTNNTTALIVDKTATNYTFVWVLGVVITDASAVYCSLLVHQTLLFIYLPCR